jgi:hydrogenase maturation protein HypF
VQIEVEGEVGLLEEFLSNLMVEAPPLARIEEISWRPVVPLGDRGFEIQQSDQDAAGPITFAPDVATCDDCLRELFDPTDRRYRYPFLNCTNCGPRLTIVRGAPYDRERTTMAGFPLCAACRAEYEDPGDRRFHAQPTACAACGPRVEILDGQGTKVKCDDPIAFTADAINEGKIAAVKGLGGYHLVCDATNASAVTMLRRRKHREEKPFAVMVRDVAAAEKLCWMSEAERELLESHRRPIVLLRKKSELVEEIAPGNPWLGVMLPYTPLHHLLVGEKALVMTSGNRSDEPIAIEEKDAVERLGGIADLFLVHDRPIHVRCDDSVTRVVDGVESPVRRSRGYAPEPIAVPWNCASPILAVGGQLKGTFALGSDRRAIISHHLGDLDHLQAYRAFERDIELYEQLFSLQPTCIAHDLHPDYASTRYAKGRGLPTVAVQHHHAHMASCMAEHGLTEPVIGVTFDGTGYGTDGAIWGGEFLVGDYGGFQRAAHLRYVPMPGGEKAAREPWRMAAAHLMDAQVRCDTFEARLSAESLHTVRQMMARKFNCPMTSSMGRLFDAVASLAGVRDFAHYEGQAAIELEFLGLSIPINDTYVFELENGHDISIDTRPVIRGIVADVAGGVEAAQIARRFHSTLVEIIHTGCRKIREISKIDAVVLSGGVFMNALLSVEATHRLAQAGFRVYRHQKVPTNDGGLSLGQLAVAANQQRSR